MILRSYVTDTERAGDKRRSFSLGHQWEGKNSPHKFRLVCQINVCLHRTQTIRTTPTQHHYTPTHQSTTFPPEILHKTEQRQVSTQTNPSACTNTFTIWSTHTAPERTHSHTRRTTNKLKCIHWAFFWGFIKWRDTLQETFQHFCLIMDSWSLLNNLKMTW